MKLINKFVLHDIDFKKYYVFKDVIGHFIAMKKDSINVEGFMRNFELINEEEYKKQMVKNKFKQLNGSNL